MKHSIKDKAFIGGLAAAYTAFALTFRGPRTQFWNRMTATGLTLGSLSLASRPELRKTRIGPKEVALGLGSAGVLYVIFQIGDRLARVIMPNGAAEIEDIYKLQHLGSKKDLAARLTTIIGPAEELFWRGVVQGTLMDALGKPLGTVLGTAAYGGAHLVTGNFTLIGAASIAGGYWGSLYAAGMPMGALIVSHSVWDVYTFLIAPTTQLKKDE
ncbi:MAG: CPBP family intramembrane glutamic endopeptidase [Chloroflexia bacterium]